MFVVPNVKCSVLASIQRLQMKTNRKKIKLTFSTHLGVFIFNYSDFNKEEGKKNVIRKTDIEQKETKFNFDMKLERRKKIFHIPDERIHINTRNRKKE